MKMHLAKVFKVYQKLLRYWKESDLGRRLKHFAEKKESDEKIGMKRLKTLPEKKGMQLYTLLPGKSSCTMSNKLIDKTAV
jgi:hypothetical protein